MIMIWIIWECLNSQLVFLEIMNNILFKKHLNFMNC